MSTVVTDAPTPPLVGDLRRFWALTWTLAITDWKLRFYGSALGYLWQLVRPFAFFGVIYVVFTEIVGLGDQINHYGVYILFGLVIFNYFAEVTNNCVVCLAQRENLLRKTAFPRLAIPLSTALAGLFNLVGTLLAVFIFTVGNGIYPDFGWLELVPLILLLALLTTGVGLVLSVMYVRYRDIQPIWEVVTQILFYASPVLYVSTMVDDCCQRPYVAQPIATILTEVRHAIIDSDAPTAAAAIGGGVRLLIPLGIVAAVLGFGLWLFRREAPRIAEHL